MGKVLILTGIVIVLLGILVSFCGHIPLLGKLSGDIFFRKGSVSFYFPIVTSLLLSVILTLIINFVLRVGEW